MVTSLRNSLEERKKLAMDIAGADLTTEIDANEDFYGLALPVMAKSLRDIVAPLRAAPLEKITSYLTGMASKTQLDSENASQANRVSGQAKAAAVRGNEQMKAMVSAMGDIRDAGPKFYRIR